MKCRACSWPESNVVDSRPAKEETQVRRRRECPRCHRRWTTFEREERGSSTFEKPQLIVAAGTTNSAQAPPQIDTNPPTNSVGGIGGGLSTPLGTTEIEGKAKSDPELLEASSPGNPNRARARKAREPLPDFVPMRNEFVAQWEARYADKYLFEPKDGTHLAAMIRKHPQTVSRWPLMVTRYLESAFWADLRHPLTGLATNPVQFAGETNGHARFSKTNQATIRGLQGFVAKGGAK